MNELQNWMCNGGDYCQFDNSSGICDLNYGNFRGADAQTNKGLRCNDMNLKVLGFKSGQFQKSELRV